MGILDFGFKQVRGKVTEELFKRQTKRVALDVISLVESLPASRTANVIGRQLIRSGTSIGANYRAACRGKSKADLLFKLSIVEEEADETVYWLELLIESHIVSKARVAALLKETDEIIAMIVASIKTLRERNDQFRNHHKSKIKSSKLEPDSYMDKDSSRTV